MINADPLDRALAEFSEAMRRNGIDSNEAWSCFQRYKNMRGFCELAAESVLLRVAVKRVEDGADGDRFLFGFLSGATAALCLVLLMLASLR